MMANIKINKLQIISPLIIEGKASNKEPTATLKDSLFEITLSILNALNDLNTFNDLKMAL
jgi:hypothetical protein